MDHRMALPGAANGCHPPFGLSTDASRSQETNALMSELILGWGRKNYYYEWATHKGWELSKQLVALQKRA
jgi:hypothetical protein